MPALSERNGRRAPFRERVFHADPEEEKAGPYGGLLPNLSEEDLREIKFQLAYIQHGGSGLNFAPSEIDELDFGEAQGWLERLEQERERESEAIRKASRR